MDEKTRLIERYINNQPINEGADDALDNIQKPLTQQNVRTGLSRSMKKLHPVGTASSTKRFSKHTNLRKKTKKSSKSLALLCWMN